MRSPQFFPNPHETLGKLLPHEVIISTNFHEDWTKIVDFSLMADFERVSFFFLGLYYRKCFKDSKLSDKRQHDINQRHLYTIELAKIISI